MKPLVKKQHIRAIQNQIPRACRLSLLLMGVLFFLALISVSFAQAKEIDWRQKDPGYNHIGPYIHGKAWVIKNQLFGFIDAKGHEIIEPQYEEVYPLPSGEIIVAKEGKFGLLSKEGTPLLPMAYSHIDSVNDQALMLYSKETYTLTDLKGRVLSPRRFYAYQVGEASNLIAAMDAATMTSGYIDTQGKEYLPFKYQAAAPFEGNYAQVADVNGYGLIDKKGAWLVKPKYLHIFSYVANAEVQHIIAYDQNFKFIHVKRDASGEVETPLDVESIIGLLQNQLIALLSGPQPSLAHLSYEGQSKPIDLLADRIEPLTKDGAYYLFQLGMHWGVIDQDGKVCLEPDYYDVLTTSSKDYPYIGVKPEAITLLGPDFKVLQVLEATRLVANTPDYLLFKKGDTLGRLLITEKYPMTFDLKASATPQNKVVILKKDTSKVSINGNPVEATLFLAEDKHYIRLSELATLIKGSNSSFAFIESVSTSEDPVKVKLYNFIKEYSGHLDQYRKADALKVPSGNFKGLLEQVPAYYSTRQAYSESPNVLYREQGQRLLASLINFDLGMYEQLIQQDYPSSFEIGDPLLTRISYEGEYYYCLEELDKIKLFTKLTITSKGPTHTESSLDINTEEVADLATIKDTHPAFTWLKNTEFLKPLSGFYEGYAVVMQADGQNLMDRSGQLLLPMDYDTVEPFKNGLAVVSTFGTWGAVNRQGNFVIPLKYKDIKIGGDGSYVLQDQAGKITMYDSKGKVQLKLEGRFDSVMPFTEGLAPVSKDGKWGYINSAGKIVVPLQYKKVTPFRGGRAFVGREPVFKFGATDEQGQGSGPISNPSAASNADPLTVSLVSISDEDFLEKNIAFAQIDKTGKVVSDWRYRHVPQTEPQGDQRLWLVAQGDQFGALNLDGKVAIPFEYETIYPITGGYFGLKGNKNVFFDHKGKVIRTIYKSGERRPLNQGFLTFDVNPYFPGQGLISPKGQVLVDERFLETPVQDYFIGSDPYVLAKGNQLGIMTLDGKPASLPKSQATTRGPLQLKPQRLTSFVLEAVDIPCYSILSAKPQGGNASQVSGSEQLYVRLEDLATALEDTEFRFQLVWHQTLGMYILTYREPYGSNMHPIKSAEILKEGKWVEVKVHAAGFMGGIGNFKVNGISSNGHILVPVKAIENLFLSRYE